MKATLAMLAALGFLGSTGLEIRQEQLDPTTLSSLVGTEPGMYLRGEAVLSGGQAVVSLPGYFEAYTRPESRTVQLTAVGSWSPLFVSRVSGGQFSVSTAQGGNPNQAFFWEVKAVRRKADPVKRPNDSE